AQRALARGARGTGRAQHERGAGRRWRGVGGAGPGCVDRSAVEGVPDGADHVVEGAGGGGLRGHPMSVSASHVPGAARSVGCAPRPRGDPGARGGTDGCRGEPMTTRWTTVVPGTGAVLVAALALAGCGVLPAEP